MQPRGTANDHQIHRPVLQKLVEALVGPATIFAAETRNLFFVGSVNRCNFHAGNGTRRASVRFRYVAAADKADVSVHEICEITDTPPQNLCRPLPLLRESESPRR